MKSLSQELREVGCPPRQRPTVNKAADVIDELVEVLEAFTDKSINDDTFNEMRWVALARVKGHVE